jgi:uncharacterized membrane protein
MVFVDNAQRGPYSVEQLENFVERNELPSSAFVWTEGMTDWQPIATVVSPPAASRPAAPPVFAPRAPQVMPPVTTLADSSLKESDYTFMLVAHILMAASILTGGLTAIAAVIMAYIKQGEVRGTYLESHAKNLIETFWWSLAIGVIGGILTLVFVGLFVLLGGFIWFVYRCIMAIVRISERRAI